MNSKKLILILTLSLLLSLPGFTQDEGDKEVVVSGISDIVGGNTMAAREKALTNAYRAAVESGVGSMVESNSITQNFQLITDNIYSKSQGYVKSFDVVSEGMGDAPNTYKVTIKAIVNMTQMGDDLRSLGILQDIMGMPKIMSMIDEVSTSSGASVLSSDPSSSIAVEEKLLKKGFELVDKEMVQKIRSKEMARMDELMENDDAISRIAKEAAEQYGAQYLLLGVANIEPYSDSGGMKTATSAFKCKIVDTSTGEKLATTQKAETGAGTSWGSADMNAGSRSGALVADTVIPMLIQNWSKRSQQGVVYIVKLYGVESYGNQGRKFMRAVESIPGVTGCVKRMWDANLKRLELDVTYKGGSADGLIDGIFEVSADIPGFENLDLEEQTGNNMNFKI